jgi:gliding motility-associated-like protein
VAISTDSSITASTSGNYSLLLTNANGCSDSTSVQLTAFSLPQAQIDSSGPLAFCAGDSVVLTAGGVDARFCVVTWFRDGVAISTDSSITASTSGTYSLVLTNANGCNDSSSVQLTVYSLPIAQIDSSGPLAFCSGDSVVLRSANAGNYQWFRNGVAISTDPSITARTSGTYSLVLTNANGCKDSSSTQVQLHALPDSLVQIMGSTQLCAGDSVVLQAPSGLSYQWLFNGSPIAGANQQQISAHQSGSWSVLLTNANGCTVQSAAVQTAIVLPPVAFGMRASSLEKCANDSILLEATFYANATYLWYLNGNLLPGNNQNQLQAHLAGTYHCEVQYGSGCNQLLPPLTIREFQLPASLGLPEKVAICAGETIDLAALLVAHGTYFWSGPDNFSSNMHRAILSNIDFRQHGWYVVSLSMPGCGSLTDSVYVEVQQGLGKIEIEGKSVICAEGKLKLRATEIDGANYSWTLASGKKIEGARLDLAGLERTDAGFAELLVNRGNCAEMQRIFIEYFEGDIYFPTAFTPNNDGLNDSFGPETHYQGELSWEIYDRWGKLVYRSLKADDKWDGTIEGEAAMSGTYSVVCTSKNCSNQTIVQQGVIKLIR